jgi:thymidine kinase
MKVMAFLPALIQLENIESRVGLSRPAILFNENFNFYEYLKDSKDVRCIFIDEAQFLNKKHVLQLGNVVDLLNIPVLCYGLRTDFKGELFEGSKYLLGLADKLIELKTVCVCGKKATMNLRKKESGDLNEVLIPITEGDQIDIGGNDKYVSLCRKCFYSKLSRN